MAKIAPPNPFSHRQRHNAEVIARQYSASGVSSLHLDPSSASEEVRNNFSSYTAADLFQTLAINSPSSYSYEDDIRQLRLKQAEQLLESLLPSRKENRMWLLVLVDDASLYAKRGLKPKQFKVGDVAIFVGGTPVGRITFADNTLKMF